MKVNYILLVDDDEISNILNFGLLSKLSVADQIKVASDGQSALNLLKDCLSKSQKAPELIILDLYMPNMNGWEFLEEFNKLELNNKSKTKVIVLSGMLSSGHVEELKNMGVKEVIKKPLTKEIKESIVKHCYSAGA